jgi:hypothetical protein
MVEDTAQRPVQLPRGLWLSIPNGSQKALDITGRDGVYGLVEDRGAIGFPEKERPLVAHLFVSGLSLLMLDHLGCDPSEGRDRLLVANPRALCDGILSCGEQPFCTDSFIACGC